MNATVDHIARMREMIGVKRGPTAWRTVTQSDIDAFAQVSGDHYWIHTDVERARRESPFGTTVAHGNLTLSMIDGMRQEIPARVPADLDALVIAVNMGWNRVRFPAPVAAGSRVRTTAELVSVEQRGGGWLEVVDRFTVEVEGIEKPACVADSVSRNLLRVASRLAPR